MGRRDEVRRGSDRLRIGSWRGSDRVALVTPVGGGRPPGVAVVAMACDELARRGYREVLTGALADDERAAFEAQGFSLRDSLHLLAHDLSTEPGDAGDVRLSRGRRRDRRSVLVVDGRAFPPFWRLDGDGLLEALTATPAVRFRVACDGRRVVAYAVTGRAEGIGYLQRLAVDPDVEGRGLGRALVADALGWLRAAGSVQAVVNTQVHNERALALYRGMGFRQLPTGLSVLGRDLVDREHQAQVG